MLFYFFISFWIHRFSVFSNYVQSLLFLSCLTYSAEGNVTRVFSHQEMIVPNNVIDLPPPSPPKPKTIVLPPNWKVARDPEGKIYYYHIVTRLVGRTVCVHGSNSLRKSLLIWRSCLCFLLQADAVGSSHLGRKQWQHQCGPWIRDGPGNPNLWWESFQGNSREMIVFHPFVKQRK